MVKPVTNWTASKNGTDFFTIVVLYVLGRRANHFAQGHAICSYEVIAESCFKSL